MKRGPILKLLILFLLGGLYACEDRMYIESDGGILQTRSLGVVSPEWLVDCARTDYPVQFVNMPEPYAGLNISHWDCFVVEQDDDTCTIISLPMDTVSTKFVSEFFIVRKYDRVNYYIRVLPNALAEAPYKYMYGKVDVNLFVVSPEQTVCYNGFVMNERFHLNLLEDNKILLMSEDTIDGGELPGVVITPGEGKPNPNPDPEPDPLPYPDPDPVDPNWPWWSTGGGGDGGSSDGGALAGLAGMFKGGTNMNADVIERLKIAIEEINEDCTYKQMFDYIKKNYSSQGSILVHDSLSLGLAWMDSKGNLNFASFADITPTNLWHELVHVYQSEYGDKNFDENNAGLMEFELALFGDVYMQLKLGGFLKLRNGNIPDQGSWISSMQKNDSISQKDYKDLIEKVAKEKEISSEDFYEWAKWFGLYDRNYSNKGYNFSNETYGTKIINSLLGMLDECYE